MIVNIDAAALGPTAHSLLFHCDPHISGRSPTLSPITYVFTSGWTIIYEHVSGPGGTLDKRKHNQE